VRDRLGSAVWRLTIFMIACALGLFALLAVFAQLRFEKTNTYHAVFTNVSGLKSNQFVRIGGVEVGKVTDIKIRDDASVFVAFTTDSTVTLTKATKAVIRYDDLIGGRYLALQEGAGDPAKLNPGDTLPESQTQPALDLDALIGGFRPLFRALDPDQVNQLSSSLIQAFQGEGQTIGSVLTQTSALTNTLADRDELIQEVITNLDTVLKSLGDQSTQFGTAIDSLSQLVGALAARKTDVGNAVAHVNASARTLADLLVQTRPPLQDAVKQLDRTTSIAVADHDYLDGLLKSLPDTYAVLARQGIYGDFFSFYLCDAVAKLNGKGGQPVYVKLAGQDTGRCAPK
jgi:phospholipid/cholesterol/gamma-HCH transport system substrate-binding protein